MCLNVIAYTSKIEQYFRGSKVCQTVFEFYNIHMCQCSKKKQGTATEKEQIMSIVYSKKSG